MKYGIYYAYWEHEWGGDYLYYIDKAARLGFDILEIAAAPLWDYTKEEAGKLKLCAKENHIELTVGHGPKPEQNIASPDPEIRKNALGYFRRLFQVMEQLDSHLIGGALYSYWPVDYSKPVDKKGDWERGVEGVAKLAAMAREHGITLGLEVLNRFENHVLNTAKEGVAFVKEVGEPNVKVMLDTFHMNIEEQSIGEAIRSAGAYLGHFHTGECNRMVPGQGRMPWREIRDALRDIQYDKAVVMEPFVLPGGTVGKDIKVWRDLKPHMDEASLDRDAQQALQFSRYILETE